MVSFSCEGCGDVLTKKKLDGHRNQCWNASYTCIDCMKHFQGTSYKAHTSCMSEAQKYQGKLYKEKKPKGQQNGNSNNNSQALVPTKAAVEQAPAVVDVPPAAPSPPPAVNVFDFLVTDDSTPTAPRISHRGPTADETRMIENAQDATTSNTTTTQDTPGPSSSEQDRRYEGDGHHYHHLGMPGLDRFDSWDVEPTPHKHQSRAPYTPANKWNHHRREPQEQSTIKSSKSDKKRKRQHDDATAEDTTMIDAPPMLHTGLTGGLNKMTTVAGDAAFPSPDESGEAADDSNDAPSPSASSPIKRKKHSAALSTKEHSRKDKDAKKSKKSKHENADTTTKRRGREIVRVRRRRASSSSPEARKPKAIEFLQQEDSGAVVKYDKYAAANAPSGNARADLFFSLVTKDSEKGVSLNKALKRYFKEQGTAISKVDEEKELWKALRLRRNDRGEVVLFADA